jgi:hypothetical protein
MSLTQAFQLLLPSLAMAYIEASAILFEKMSILPV